VCVCVCVCVRDNVSAWDADFIDIDDKTLFELILAANYMDVIRVDSKTAVPGSTPNCL